MNQTLILPTPPALTRNFTAPTHVTFRLKDEYYAIPLSKVESVSLMPLQGVPMRGRTVSLIDLRSLLGVAKTGTDNNDGLIILNGDGTEPFERLAFLVDEVEDIVSIDPDKVSPARYPGAVEGRFFTDGNQVSLLDLDQITALQPCFSNEVLAA